MPQGFLGNVVIIQPDVAMNRCLQRFAAVEAMGGEYLADAPVEALDHAVRLRAARFGQPMLDVERLARGLGQGEKFGNQGLFGGGLHGDLLSLFCVCIIYSITQKDKQIVFIVSPKTIASFYYVGVD